MRGTRRRGDASGEKASEEACSDLVRNVKVLSLLLADVVERAERAKERDPEGSAAAGSLMDGAIAKSAVALGLDASTSPLLRLLTLAELRK